MCPRCWWLPLLLLAVAPVVNSAPPSGYYAPAQNQTGALLRLALHTIIKDHDTVPYSSSVSVDTVDALSVLDQDPANTNNVMLIYSRRSEPKASFNVSGGWNREHLWPDSYGIDGHQPMYTDLHNLRPEDINVNSSRGNKFFDLSSTNDAGYRAPGYAEAPLTTADSDSWEPPDAVKGDIARAMFYMDVRYESVTNNELNFILSDGTGNIGTSTNLMGRLSTLIRWHFADPPDAAEQLRNDRVYERYQHNRNPFVDHPQYAALLWPDKLPTLSLLPAEPGEAHAWWLTWSTNHASATVESTTGLPVNWSAVIGTPIRMGDSFALPIQPTNTMRVFRLR